MREQINRKEKTTESKALSQIINERTRRAVAVSGTILALLGANVATAKAQTMRSAEAAKAPLVDNGHNKKPKSTVIHDALVTTQVIKDVLNHKRFGKLYEGAVVITNPAGNPHSPNLFLYKSPDFKTAGASGDLMAGDSLVIDMPLVITQGNDTLLMSRQEIVEGLTNMYYGADNKEHSGTDTADPYNLEFSSLNKAREAGCSIRYFAFRNGAVKPKMVPVIKAESRYLIPEGGEVYDFVNFALNEDSMHTSELDTYIASHQLKETSIGISTH